MDGFRLWHHCGATTGYGHSIGYRSEAHHMSQRSDILVLTISRDNINVMLKTPFGRLYGNLHFKTYGAEKREMEEREQFARAMREGYHEHDGGEDY